jgi:CHAD domain-containing protein
LADRFFELASGELADDQTLHALRIRAKRWRYALELAAGVLPGPFASDLYRDLGDLQNRLGAVLDQAAMELRISKMLSDASGAARKAALNELLARQQATTQSLRDEFRHWWSPARREQLRKQWRQAVA